MRKSFLSNPLALEIATYAATVLIAAGLSLSHWAAPLFTGGQSSFLP